MSTEEHSPQEPEQQIPENEQAAAEQQEGAQAEASPEQDMEQMLTDLAAARDQVLRTQAEMQNLRRRWSGM